MISGLVQEGKCWAKLMPIPVVVNSLSETMASETIARLVYANLAQVPVTVEKALAEIAKLEGVQDVVVLADVHLKDKYLQAPYKASVPSSIAIASDRQYLYPQLRSRGIGCGMMFIRTGLTIDGLGHEVVKPLVQGLARVFNGAPRRALDSPSLLADQLELSNRDMVPMSLYGAPWLVEKAGEKSGLLDQFINGGAYIDPASAEVFSWEGISERWQKGAARPAVLAGRDLVGNHFLELQVVDREPVDNRFKGLKRGELVLMYHGSCNGLSRILDPQLIPQLIMRPSFEHLSPDGKHYDVIVNASRLLMNWSAAARALVLLRIRRLIADIFPSHGGPVECLSEGPHNGIFVDEDEAEPIIYRHNTAVLDKAIPTIVSGRNDHPSYLVLPGAEVKRALHSIDHGLGTLLKGQAPLTGRGEAQMSRTLRLRSFHWARWSKAADTTRLLDSSTVERGVLETYFKHQLILEDYARMVPLWTFKNDRYSYRTIARGLVSIVKGN